jgi:hypothetical protein
MSHIHVLKEYLYLCNKTKKCTCIKYSTLMMIIQAIKTCQELIIYDETCFVHVHLLVLLLKFKNSCSAQIWNMFCHIPFLSDNSCVLYRCDVINIKQLVFVSGLRDVKVLYHFVKKSSDIF